MEFAFDVREAGSCGESLFLDQCQISSRSPQITSSSPLIISSCDQRYLELILL